MKIPIRIKLLGLTLPVLLGIAACKQPAKNASSPGAPVRKADIRFAHGFTIDDYPHYRLVRVFDRLADHTDTLQYILLEKGDPAPAGFSNAQIIHTPVKSVVGMSSMHVALMDFLGVSDRITGLGSLDYISSPEVRDRIKTGKVNQVGLDGNLNNELLLTMHPDVMLAMGNPEIQFGKYKILTNAGIPVLLVSEWLENTPLGRAEWVKLLAALVDKEDLAEKKFDSIAQAYQTLAVLASRAHDKPRVIIGTPFKGSWYVPAGGSYMAQFLRDAGADYKWSDTKGTGSLALNFESVAPEALEADDWLNIGYLSSKKDLADKDSRFTAFKSFRTDRLYNNDLRTNDIGSNDYWESGGVNPQLIRADLIHILHSNLLPGHTLYYYRQLK